MSSSNCLPGTIAVHPIHLDWAIVIITLAFLFVVGELIAALYYSNKGKDGQNVTKAEWNSFYGYSVFTFFIVGLGILMLVFIMWPYLWTKTK